MWSLKAEKLLNNEQKKKEMAHRMEASCAVTGPPPSGSLAQTAPCLMEFLTWGGGGIVRHTMGPVGVSRGDLTCASPAVCKILNASRQDSNACRYIEPEPARVLLTAEARRTDIMGFDSRKSPYAPFTAWKTSNVSFYPSEKPLALQRLW